MNSNISNYPARNGKQFTDMHQKVNLMIYPYCKKFVIEKGFIQLPNIVTETSVVGMYLVALLSDKKCNYDYQHIKPNAIEFELFIPKMTAVQSKPTIDEQGNYHFNSFLEKLMHLDLFARIESARLYSDKTTKSVIFDFIDEFELDNKTMTYESLKKAHYRYKNKLNAISNRY